MTNLDVFKQLAELSNASANPQAYSQVLSRIFTSPDQNKLSSDLEAYCQNVITGSLGIVNSRSLLSELINKLKDIPSIEARIDVSNRIIEVLQPKVISFEEQDTHLKLLLADNYEQNEDYVSSAKVLQTITLDSSQRFISDNDKAAIYIRIVRCYLEEDDPISASTFLNRTKNIIHDVTDRATNLQFLLSKARISDSQRQFVDASRTYYDISQEPDVDEHERLQAMSAAVICAVLDAAGPQRAQQLTKLFQDERAIQLDEYSILEKIVLGRILNKEEVNAFSKKLKPHHLAATSDGSTVLDKAVLEHNLLAASKLYLNMKTVQLGKMLGVDGDDAEIYAARMIQQGRLKGYIDQIEGIVYFETESDGLNKKQVLWDNHVRGLAEEVEIIAEVIQKDHPEFYKDNMVY